MPRPSKHVSPDTLGGRIRAAREQLQLSLADVACGQYSTSFLSQIERNRVEPSPESLRFLAAQLHLPLEDLELLAQKQRTLETDIHQIQCYEDLRSEAHYLFIHKDITEALSLLQPLHISEIPASLRWRIAALRGQCHFEQRHFLKAQQDLMYAASEHPQPDKLPSEQKQELVLLHMHLAATFRELRQFDAAQENYDVTLTLMNADTPLGHVAEAHWGLALIAFARANTSMRDTGNHNTTSITQPVKQDREAVLQLALQHAEYARFLYCSINERLPAASVTCQIAEIEQALGNNQKAYSYLKETLADWSYVLDEPDAMTPAEARRQQNEASVVCAAASTLAALAFEEHLFTEANAYIRSALAAGKRSYRVRRANAYLMQGKILSTINPYDPAAEEAFRLATEILEGTQRVSARIGAHVRFGHYLLKVNKIPESERELEKARQLSDLIMVFGPTTSIEDTALS